MERAVITLSLTLDARYMCDVKYFRTKTGVALGAIRRKQSNGRTVYFGWHSMNSNFAPGFYTEGAAVRYVARRLTGRQS